MASSPVLPTTPEAESLLLVEERNDSNAVFQLVRLRYGKDPVFGISDCGGAEGALRNLSGRLAEGKSPQTVLG
jgi:hypothetical protein